MAEDARPRIVLLGASNVTLALRPIVEIARGVRDTPLEILAAHGHGRSYGTWSRAFFVRDLPSIAECGLWNAIGARRASETFALVTDVGNDLVYGRRVDEILAWVARDLERLRAIEAHIVVTRLPIASLAELSPLRFRLVQSLLFPARRIELRAIQEGARELDERLAQLLATHAITAFEPRGEWYGFDPIHVRARWRDAAFAQVLASWRPVRGARRLEAHDVRALRSARPALRRFFRRIETCAQPCVHFADGSTFASY